MDEPTPSQPANVVPAPSEPSQSSITVPVSQRDLLNAVMVGHPWTWRAVKGAAALLPLLVSAVLWFQASIKSDIGAARAESRAGFHQQASEIAKLSDKVDRIDERADGLANDSVRFQARVEALEARVGAIETLMRAVDRVRWNRYMSEFEKENQP